DGSLTTLQKKVYLSILRKELPKLLALSSGTSNQQSLQNIASGKLIVLDQLLEKLRSSGHRVLFAQMTHILDVLQVTSVTLV
ncbi:probable helicase CHR10 isoform X4, partial [Tanacetum coccineum]